MSLLAYKNYLAHHGIKGQKWGIRRYQNEDGSLTLEGRERYTRMGNEVNKGGIFANQSKNIFKLDLSNEKQMIREFDKQLDDLNDKVWEEESKDLDWKKLNNKNLNKYLDEQIKKNGDKWPSIYEDFDDEKLMTDIFPNMNKAIKEYSELDSEKARELKNLTKNLIENVDRFKYGSKEFKNELSSSVINKLIKDVDRSAGTADMRSDKEQNYKGQIVRYIDTIWEGSDLDDYIESYGEKKGIKFKW